MDQNIDDASYVNGRELFASGASLRSIIERAPDRQPPTPEEDDNTFSTVLGFVDAMFDVVRGAILK
jgi:hypothetical protein